jgi:hypothetical protein
MRCALTNYAAVLTLLSLLGLAGCDKSASTQSDLPQKNPVLPEHGQRLQSGGAVQNVRQAARRTADLNQLRNFALAYFQYSSLNNRAPSSIDDIKDSLDADTINAFKEGFYMPVWKVRGSSSETIVCYVKDPDSYGTRIVGTADGGARRMNSEEFEAAIKKK